LNNLNFKILNVNILGIETSCDETAASVVKDGIIILSKIVASSAEMHAKTGGIIPEQAARQQVKSIIPVIESALQEAFPKSNTSLVTKKIDAIAVTFGPGLIGSLLVGVETAKTLSAIWKKPIIPVNHLVGHIYANWLLPKPENKNAGRNGPPEFPALCLLASGGHTDLVLMTGHNEIIWIGGTRDDAAGEAFDKCARLLRLGYPGGPAIAKEAAKYSLSNTKRPLHLPRPMINEDNFDFSFSGLKTAVHRRAQKTKNIEKKVPEISYEVQEAICDVLIAKTLKAAEKYKPKSLLLAGGVAANARLQEKFAFALSHQSSTINFFVPSSQLCTDNAACIASCAYFNNTPLSFSKIDTNPQLTITGQL
jgi:N6-L-threonylcarbamoyladenine synthase